MPNQNSEQKVKELEQRVAALEGQVQEQIKNKRENALGFLANTFSETNHNSQLATYDNSQVD